MSSTGCHIETTPTPSESCSRCSQAEPTSTFGKLTDKDLTPVESDLGRITSNTTCCLDSVKSTSHVDTHRDEEKISTSIQYQSDHSSSCHHSTESSSDSNRTNARQRQGHSDSSPFMISPTSSPRRSPRLSPKQQRPISVPLAESASRSSPAFVEDSQIETPLHETPELEAKKRQELIDLLFPPSPPSSCNLKAIETVRISEPSPSSPTTRSSIVQDSQSPRGSWTESSAQPSTINDSPNISSPALSRSKKGKEKATSAHFEVYTIEDSEDEDLPDPRDIFKGRTRDLELTDTLNRLTLSGTPTSSNRKPLPPPNPARVTQSGRRSRGADPRPCSAIKSDDRVVQVHRAHDSDADFIDDSQTCGGECEDSSAESEFDPDDGVLLYEPIKTPSRPRRLGPTHYSMVSTPTPETPAPPPPRRKPHATPCAPSRIVELDLTLSSDDSEDGDQDLPVPYPPVNPRATATRSLSLDSSTPTAKPFTPNPLKTIPPKKIGLTKEQKSTLPQELMDELNRLVFGRDYASKTSTKPLLSPLSGGEMTSTAMKKGLPTNIEIIWNNKLLKTAGRASWKKTTTSSKVGPTAASHSTEGKRAEEKSSIDLSVKVIDSIPKLNNTLAHELCHLAAWSLSGEMKPPHGDAFKLWAARVMYARPDIEITTTHSYQIDYKYRWRCVSMTCQQIFGRHSRSLDPTTHGCPCGNRLVEIDRQGNVKSLPAATTNSKKTAAGFTSSETPVKKRSNWQEYVAVMSPRIRALNPSIKPDEVFKKVAEQWKEDKENWTSEQSARN